MNYIQSLIAMVLGHRCAACNQPCIGSIVCKICIDQITRNQLQKKRCIRCASALNQSFTSHLIESKEKSNELPMCLKCSTHSFAFDAAVCVGGFDNPLSQLISQLKFSHCLIIAPWFARQLFTCINQLPNHLQSFDIIVPIPLHINRLRERGFNQSWEIIKHLPYLNVQKKHVLERLKDTPSQRNMNALERIHNVKEAFIVPESSIHLIKNKRILLIDDVVTTTATANAASIALKSAGVAHITLASIARVDYL